MKLNGFPVSKNIVSQILTQNRKTISKMHNGELMEIPINKIEIVQVTIV